MQVEDATAEDSTLTSQLNAMRKAVAEDNEEFLIQGVKGVAAAQELISQSFFRCFHSSSVYCRSDRLQYGFCSFILPSFCAIQAPNL